VTIWASDRTAYLSLDAGVAARDASGRPVETIRIVAVPTADIPNVGVIGMIESPRAYAAYACTPNGTTFTPAISLTFVLPAAEWAAYAGTAEVAWFNTTGGVWESIPAVTDDDLRTITVSVAHFSTYALFVEGHPVVEIPPSMTVTPPHPSEGSTPWIWWIVIAVLVVAGMVYFTRRRNQ